MTINKLSFTCGKKLSMFYQTSIFFSQSFQWMSRVLQAVDSIHQVGIYCLALVPPNHLPKTPLGGIHLSETRKKFLEGSLHPANVLMCPHTCVTNLPKPREVHHGNCNDIPSFFHIQIFVVQNVLCRCIEEGTTVAGCVKEFF